MQSDMFGVDEADVLEATPEPAPATVVSSAWQWAIDAIDEMAASASRLKKLKAIRETLGADALVAEVLIIAARKRSAYRRARADIVPPLGAWAAESPDLSVAYLALGAAGLPVNDVPMLPDSMETI
jgi:MoxR-like ATPase